MARKIKKLPEGIVLIHYSKNGKVVSDLNLLGWYKGIETAIKDTRNVKRSLIIRVGTENMVHITRNLVIKGILTPEEIRYKYGRRVFRIDLKGQFVGEPGKQLPPKFLELTGEIRRTFFRKRRRKEKNTIKQEANETDAPKQTTNPFYKGTANWWKWQKEKAYTGKTYSSKNGNLPPEGAPGNPYATNTEQWYVYNKAYMGNYAGQDNYATTVSAKSSFSIKDMMEPSDNYLKMINLKNKKIIKPKNLYEELMTINSEEEPQGE